jgi:hypothetical protein
MKPRRIQIEVPESWLRRKNDPKPRPKPDRKLTASIAERVLHRQVEKSGNDARDCQDLAD